MTSCPQRLIDRAAHEFFERYEDVKTGAWPLPGVMNNSRSFVEAVRFARRLDDQWELERLKKLNER